MSKFSIKTKIYSGDNSISELKNMTIKNALIVCDPFMEKSGKVKDITDILDELKVNYDIFSGVVPDPSIEVVSSGLIKGISVQPDTIIALGGGSAMDTAKVIRQLLDNFQAKLICIPSTSGTGSEVTSFAVISDPSVNGKYALVDDKMIPDIAILDPNLTKSVPPAITADTGMDVITHDLEAYVSCDHTNFSDAFAEKSIRIVWKDLPVVVKNGDNMEARKMVHDASCMAGMAFSEASLGICHSLAHALGGRFHKAHGRLNAMLLPYVIQYNSELDANQETETLHRYAQIARLLNISSYSDKSTVNLLIGGIKRLTSQLSIPKTIDELGVDVEEYKKAVPEMAKAALKDRCTKTNPVVPTQKDLEDIYLKLVKGS
ncbi:iron-containing alcohol dehydrogenase [Companilactobacillus suantsaicola]|uniref:Iron-containing alcohol dehydrogenase n=1 Tax=Companilactobacillus suantsaicola TaxID=2487723 RepID=A0A4Z0JP85_9LACO|nr:1-propanol dehydrogenase PduQ [Companilactobacillus suantsaicola]TGD24840.1 iron-containing alcohol dehydrogenase [Companilactobacillus suantsaicola]